MANKTIKKFYYVGVLQDDGVIAFIYKINPDTKYAHWKPLVKMADDEKAKKYTRGSAEDMVYCLKVNGYNAVLVQTMYQELY